MAQGPLGLVLAGHSEAVHANDGRPDPEKAKRAADVMLEMRKLDIAALEKAYAGA